MGLVQELGQLMAVRARNIAQEGSQLFKEVINHICHKYKRGHCRKG